MGISKQAIDLGAIRWLNGDESISVDVRLYTQTTSTVQSTYSKDTWNRFTNFPKLKEDEDGEERLPTVSRNVVYLTVSLVTGHPAETSCIQHQTLVCFLSTHYNQY